MVSLSLAESLEETVFWLEREIARLRAGEPSVNDGPDTSGEETAAIFDRRRREAGLV